MGVLAAVLAQARRIALDVAGILRRPIEGRREQQQQAACPAARGSRRRDCIAMRARWRSPAPESTAQLCAMASMRHSVPVARAERSAVVEPGAPVPRAVPGLALDASARPRGRARPSVARVRARPRMRRRREPSQHHRLEPAEPDALAAALAGRCGSCRRSSRRCPSAAGRATPIARLASIAARAVLEDASHHARASPAGSARPHALARGSGPSMNGHGLVEQTARRRCARGSRTARKAATGGRRRCACARPGPTAEATSAGRRPRRTAAPAARSRCSRASAGRVHAPAPCRPAAGRGTRRRRPPGRSRARPEAAASAW